MQISFWFYRRAKTSRLYVESNSDYRAAYPFDERCRAVYFSYYFKRRFHAAYHSGDNRATWILQIPFITIAMNPPDPYLN